MRPGRLAFCDAIFVLEPDRLWGRIAGAGNRGGAIGLKAVALMLTYGKADLAAAIFDRVSDLLEPDVRAALDGFFSRIAGGGGWVQQLHHDFDRWSQRV